MDEDPIAIRPTAHSPGNVLGRRVRFVVIGEVLGATAIGRGDERDDRTSDPPS
jgi:hypothetical protein